jgi:hypothetical protein
MKKIDKCTLIELPKISDPSGNLTFIENNKHIPFEIKRVYYMYDIPGGSYRGAHAHKNLHQLIIALSGSFDIEIDDGHNKKRFYLNRPYLGLYLPPMMWRFLDNFSSGAVCMVLASDIFDENDYIRDYSQFLSKINDE